MADECLNFVFLFPMLVHNNCIFSVLQGTGETRRDGVERRLFDRQC